MLRIMISRLSRNDAMFAKTTSGEADIIYEVNIIVQQHHLPKANIIKKEADAFASASFFWRSRRDLNPRYPFGVHTISSRARYDHFDTAPWVRLSCRLAYNTLLTLICQYLILHFLLKYLWAVRVRFMGQNNATKVQKMLKY